MERENFFLIVGLGNLGKRYQETRHNIGFECVEALAKTWEFPPFKTEKKFSGDLSMGQYKEKKIILFKPGTYMNRSGTAVNAIMHFYRIEKENLLVIVDDINIPLGEMRLKADSGSGGHRGLEDIERCLGTKSYPRLRVGVGDRSVGDLVSHVLGRFSQQEKNRVQQEINRAVSVVENWLEKGIVLAMNQANVRGQI